MPGMIQPRLPNTEVKSSHPVLQDRVKKLQDATAHMQMAKASVGAAVTAGIGQQPRKAFGHEGRISCVESGEQVPEYLAKIWADPAARVRFGVRWLRGTLGVHVTQRVVIDIDESVEGEVEAAADGEADRS